MPGVMRRVPAGVWIGLALAVAFDTLVQIIWKSAVLRVPTSASTLEALAAVTRQPLLWALLVIFLLQFINWMLVLAKADLSYAQPLSALSYVTVAICSATILSEHLLPLRIVGIGLVLAGVICVSSGEHHTRVPSLIHGDTQPDVAD